MRISDPRDILLAPVISEKNEELEDSTTTPPLPPGLGARDGESASLEDLLDRRLRW